ncbi:hypothetical protein TKK_0007126 [Trichogramma kaykai]
MATTNDESAAVSRTKLKELLRLRENCNWENAAERREFFCKLARLVENWTTWLPDLREIFRPDEMDWLLSEDVVDAARGHRAMPILIFADRAGYKDVFESDENGEPMLHHSTPVHKVASTKYEDSFDDQKGMLVYPGLFEIYYRFEANYVDKETGLTHLHLISEWGLAELVQKFLDSGQDPNCVGHKTGDTPLHRVLRRQEVRRGFLHCPSIQDRPMVVRSLLAHGADPNAANNKGETPLHLLCQKNENDLSETTSRCGSALETTRATDRCTTLSTGLTEV